MRAFCALLLLLAMWCAHAADAPKPMTTILIVARAELSDPHFKDSVVLVMNNIGPAPAGIIINRPTRLTVARLFPDIEEIAQLDDKVYFGGPVDLQSVSFVFRADVPPSERATRIADGVYVSTEKVLLDKLLRRPKPMEGLRIFVGYAGWAPGQLEAEIGRGDWTLKPANASTLFERKSEHPWPEQSASDSAQKI